MNEAETRAELIDPQLTASGWGVVEGAKFSVNGTSTWVEIQTGGRAKPLITDYRLVYKNRLLAVIEAKSSTVNTPTPPTAGRSTRDRHARRRRARRPLPGTRRALE